MAPPTWLPPLNSRHQHEIHVKVSPQNPKYDPVLAAPFLWIKTRVTVKFKSDQSANQRILEGLSCTKESFPIPYSILKSQSLSSSLIRIMLDVFNIPFDLTLDNDELAEIILSYGRSMRQRTCRERYNVFPLALDFAKEVKVPDSEFEAWISWYDEKMRVDPDFERDYYEAISQDRTVEELLDEATPVIKAAGAAKSCIEELEEVKAVGSSSDNYCCLICLEELVVGSKKATQLPCSHMFHGDCIVKWLQDSHTCPLCRFALPSA